MQEVLMYSKQVQLAVARLRANEDFKALVNYYLKDYAIELIPNLSNLATVEQTVTRLQGINEFKTFLHIINYYTEEEETYE